MLRAFILALHHNWQPARRGEVRDAHRRVRHVHVLAAGARCAERVDPDILFLDIDLDLVIDLRIHEHAREAGVAARVGVERRNPYQPVYADFALQQAVRVLAIHFESGALDPRAFALQAVRNHGLKALAFSPAQVHAKQHLRPILAFGPAGARMDRDDRVAMIVLAGEQHRRLQLLHQFAHALQFALDLAIHRLAFAGEFEHSVQIVHNAAYTDIVLDALLQALALLHHFLAFFGLIPEVRRGDLGFRSG